METQRPGAAAQDAEVPGSKQEGLTGTTEPPSKARRVAFRVLAVFTSLWLLALSIFGLLELVLMWLPLETISSIVGEDFSEDAVHRTHFISVGIVAWTAVLAILVQLRKPERRVAPMLQLMAIAVGAAVLFALSGTLGDWLLQEATILVPALLLAWLHPSRHELFTKPAFDRSMAGLAALATVPWAWYIVDNARLQLISADSHAEMEHWATAALMAIVLSVCAFLGSSDHAGWRLPAWIAAGASVIFGVHSLVFPGLPSALPAAWAGAAILWGVAYGVGIIRRPEAGQPEPAS